MYSCSRGVSHFSLRFEKGKSGRMKNMPTPSKTVTRPSMMKSCEGRTGLVRKERGGKGKKADPLPARHSVDLLISERDGVGKETERETQSEEDVRG
jgi:hypothetical protein